MRQLGADDLGMGTTALARQGKGWDAWVVVIGGGGGGCGL